jgi:hypothetical protein
MKEHPKCATGCDVTSMFKLPDRACDDDYCALQDTVDQFYSAPVIMDRMVNNSDKPRKRRRRC